MSSSNSTPPLAKKSKQRAPKPQEQKKQSPKATILSKTTGAPKITKKNSQKQKRAATAPKADSENDNLIATGPPGTVAPDYSLKINHTRKFVIANVNLPKVPPKFLNFNATSTRFHVDTLKFSKKYFVDVPIPEGVEIDPDCASTFNGVLLNVVMRITKDPKLSRSLTAPENTTDEKDRRKLKAKRTAVTAAQTQAPKSQAQTQAPKAQQKAQTNRTHEDDEGANGGSTGDAQQRTKKNLKRRAAQSTPQEQAQEQEEDNSEKNTTKIVKRVRKNAKNDNVEETPSESAPEAVRVPKRKTFEMTKDDVMSLVDSINDSTEGKTLQTLTNQKQKIAERTVKKKERKLVKKSTKERIKEAAAQIKKERQQKEQQKTEVPLKKSTGRKVQFGGAE